MLSYTTAYPGQQLSGLNTVNNGLNQGYNTLNSGYNTLTGQQGQYQQGQYGTGTGSTLQTQYGTQYVDMCLNWWNVSEKQI